MKSKVIPTWAIKPLKVVDLLKICENATKERAIEVLDDIQSAIEKQMKVFQMPKE